MRKLISISLFLAFFMQSTSQLWILTFFYANRDYIAKVLCVNRDRPESECHGTCQLKKQLKNSSEQQKKTSADLKNKEVHLFTDLTQSFEHYVDDFLKVNKKAFSKYIPSQSQDYFNSVFRPPSIDV